MSDKRGPDGSYEVGYGKPPVHTRFRKGQSGNPTGKRRDPNVERAKELVRQEAYRLVTVREGDRLKRMPALQAILRSHLTLAAKGNIRAQRSVLKNIQDIEADKSESRKGIIRDGRTVDGLTDDELMAICLRSQGDSR